MVEVVERLLILQDRDRRIRQTRTELAGIEPQRKLLRAKLGQIQGRIEAAKLRLRKIESDRHDLEVEAAAKREAIERYSVQQFQTRRNEEYRALEHEIETCKQEIVKLEDKQLECMEEAEKVQKELAEAGEAERALGKEVEELMAELDRREVRLTEQLRELESDRDKLAEAVEPAALARYERLAKHRGENVIVGIDRGVCGGCHVKLPAQVVVTCRGEEELTACPNCGRVLYYTRDMDLAVAD
jgi:hypothetical protein